MKIAKSLILLMILSCASSLKPNYDLLKDYSFELQEKEPYRVPYYVKFEKGDKELLYIAANHTSNKGTLTFTLIESAVHSFKPNYIIIEGVPSGKVSDGFLKFIEECSKKSFKNCGEPIYTASLARKKNIPFDGGEPDDLVIMNKLAKENIAGEDLAYFYLLRMVSQWKRQNRINNLNQKIIIIKFELLQILHSIFKLFFMLFLKPNT